MMTDQQNFKIIGDRVVANMRKIIKQGDRVASGKLYWSISYKIITRKNGLTIRFFAKDYGPKGNVVDVGRARSNKGARGSKVLENNILSWMKVKGIRPKSISAKGRGQGPRGRKREDLYRSAAYLIAEKIHNNGWKTPPSPYGSIHYTSAIDNIVLKDCLELAFKTKIAQAQELVKKQFKR